MIRDPRETYGEKGAFATNDDEAALFADYTDTDDEDIYFGGGNDADGDYDDDGNELRPRGKSRKASSANADVVQEDETDPDEDEREFNEVFDAGRRNRRPMGKQQRGRRFDDDDDTDEEMENKKSRNLQRRGGQLFVNPNAATKRMGPGRGNQQRRQGRYEKQKRDFREPDPEIGIHPDVFTKRFEKRPSDKLPTDMLSTVDRGFSADEFLKEKEISSDEDSDFDEERLVREGDEELQEMRDVSDMMRDYDRPRGGQPTTPITEESVEEEKRRQMQEGELYESDDVEIPHAADPRLQQEIEDEHEDNLKKLRSTPGGRKTLKSLNREHEWINDFPPRGKQFYENALKETPLEGPPPPAQEDQPREEKKFNKLAEKVHVVSRHDPMSSAAPLKAEDSWRQMSSEFDVEARDGDFLTDLKECRQPLPSSNFVMRD